MVDAIYNNIRIAQYPIQDHLQYHVHLHVLLLEETGVHGENHRPAVSHWQTLSHNELIKYSSISY